LSRAERSPCSAALPAFQREYFYFYQQVQWGGGFSNPLSGGGDSFQAELVNGLGNPVIVNFKVPKGWKVG
jgi:hypothetical protein